MEIYSNYKTTVDIKDNVSNIIEVREKKIKTKCTSYTLNNINNEKNSEKIIDNDKENEVLEVKDNIYDINYKTPKYILYNNRIFYKDNYYSKSTNSETFFCKKRRYNEHLKNGLFCNAIIKKIIFNNKIKYELKKEHSKECNELYLNLNTKINTKKAVENNQDFINKCHNHLDTVTNFNRKELDLQLHEYIQEELINFNYVLLL